LHPMQVRYQAAPRPDFGRRMLNSRAISCNRESRGRRSAAGSWYPSHSLTLANELNCALHLSSYLRRMPLARVHRVSTMRSLVRKGSWRKLRSMELSPGQQVLRTLKSLRRVPSSLATHR